MRLGYSLAYSSSRRGYQSTSIRGSQSIDIGHSRKPAGRTMAPAGSSRPDVGSRATVSIDLRCLGGRPKVTHVRPTTVAASPASPKFPRLALLRQDVSLVIWARVVVVVKPTRAGAQLTQIDPISATGPPQPPSVRSVQPSINPIMSSSEVRGARSWKNGRFLSIAPARCIS